MYSTKKCIFGKDNILEVSFTFKLTGQETEDFYKSAFNLATTPDNILKEFIADFTRNPTKLNRANQFYIRAWKAHLKEALEPPYRFIEFLRKNETLNEAIKLVRSIDKYEKSDFTIDGFKEIFPSYERMEYIYKSYVERGGRLDYLEALNVLRTYLRFNDLVKSEAVEAVNREGLFSKVG